MGRGVVVSDSPLEYWDAMRKWWSYPCAFGFGYDGGMTEERMREVLGLPDDLDLMKPTPMEPEVQEVCETCGWWSACTGSTTRGVCVMVNQWTPEDDDLPCLHGDADGYETPSGYGCTLWWDGKSDEEE